MTNAGIRNNDNLNRPNNFSDMDAGIQAQGNINDRRFGQNDQ